MFPITREAQGFSERLVAEGVIPDRYRDDAVHAALCVLHEMDVMVTWNMKHLVNPRKIEAINLVAMSQVRGYRPIRIHTPEEVMMMAKIYQESKGLDDVRRIKEEISKEAARVGHEKFYMSLNGTAARLVSKYRTKKRKAACR